VRFIAATNRDLPALVARGEFRRDLYFRLNGITIPVPPLRERPAEIGPLAAHFLHLGARRAHRRVPALAPDVLPILRAMGNPERIIRIGESGAGQLCKVCNQIVIGGTLTVVSEAIALARKAHVDPANVREALLGGFAASRVLDVHGERILTGNYKPGFRAALYAKDYRIAAETLAAHDAPAPVSSVVKGLVDTLASTRGDDDYSALATIIFDMARLS